MGSGTSIPNIGSSAIGDPIGKAVVELIAEDKKYREGLKGGEKALELFDKKTQKIAKRAGKAFLAGGVAITAALTGVIFHAAKAGDELDKMSLRTGVTVEDLSRLSFAAERSGSDITALETSLRFLSRRMDEASQGIGIAKEAFEDLGISLRDQGGQLRSQPEVIKDVATAIAGLESETRQVALAMDIFGARSGPGLLPLLKQGEAGIQALMDRADELGIVISTDAAAASAEFTDRMLELSKTAKMAAFELGQALLPAAEKIVETITELIARFNKLDASMKAVTGQGLAVGAAIALLGGGVLTLIGNLPKLIAGLKLLSGLSGALPIVGGVLAFAAAVKLAADATRDFNQSGLQSRRIADVNIEIMNGTDAFKELGDIVFVAKGATEELEVGVGNLFVTMEKMDIATRALGDDILVTDSQFETIKGTLGDTGGFISVAQAAEKIVKELAAASKAIDDKALADAATALATLKDELAGAAAAGTSFLDTFDRLPTAMDRANLALQRMNENVKDLTLVTPEHESAYDPLIAAAQRAKRELEFIDIEQPDIIPFAFPDIPDVLEDPETTDVFDFIIKRNRKIRAEQKKFLSESKRDDAIAERERQQQINDLVTAQERAAEDVLRAWRVTRDGITDAFTDLFDGIIREGKADWQTFLDDLGRMFSKKFAEMLADKTVGRLLDKLAGTDTGVNTVGVVEQAATTQATKSIFGRIFGTGGTAAGAGTGLFASGQGAGISGLGTIAPGAVGGGGGGTLAAAGIPTAAAIAAPLILPLAGLIQSRREEKERDRKFLADLASRLSEFNFSVGEMTEIMNRQTKIRSGQAKEELIASGAAPRQRPGRRGQQARESMGDEFVSIGTLQVVMPEGSRGMSKAELDRETSRQIGSVARAFRRNEGARRSVLRG